MIFNSYAACLHSSWIGVHKKHVFSRLVFTSLSLSLTIQTHIREPVLIEIHFWCDYIKVLLLMYPMVAFDVGSVLVFTIFFFFLGRQMIFFNVLFFMRFERTKQKTSGAKDPSDWLKNERVGSSNVIDFSFLVLSSRWSFFMLKKTFPSTSNESLMPSNVVDILQQEIIGKQKR